MSDRTIDVYFTSTLPVDRDDVEDALDALEGFEVVGAGGGEDGSAIDLEIASSVSHDEALELIAHVLDDLGLARIAYLKTWETDDRIEVTELLS